MNKLGIVNGLMEEPLLEEGVEQAKTVAQNTPASIKVIISSPMHRAQQTANIVAAANGNLPVLTDNLLREVSLGTLAGKRWDEMPDGQKLKVKHRDMQYDYTPYEGDSVKDTLARVKKFTEKLAHQYADHEVLVVTHGGIVRSFMLLQSGDTVGDQLPNAQLIEFNCEKILK